MDGIIKVQGLKKTFKVPKRDKAGFIPAVKSLFKREFIHVHALDGVDMNIGKGEIRGLIGPNGAGKSTMIKILSGILYPSEGQVEVMGFTPWLQRETYVKNLGVVFGQKTQLWWDLPAIDTFTLNKKMYGIPEKTFNENLDYFKKLLDIEEVVKRPVRQLSLGEKMKCELVCAMLHEPQLIYLDEPTIGLDIITKENVRNFIRQVRSDKQTTFILTTHDLDDIENLCENVTIINKGQVVYDHSLDGLRDFFSKKKIVNVKFSRSVEPDALGQFDLRYQDSMSAGIEINLEEKDLQKEVSRIFSTLPVHDIDITSIGVEEVIKQIYKE